FLVLPADHALLPELTSAQAPILETVHDTADVRPLSLLGAGAIAAERAEQELVRRILHETNGNRKAAARRMNICYKALLNKLKKWSPPQTVAQPPVDRADA